MAYVRNKYFEKGNNKTNDTKNLCLIPPTDRSGLAACVCDFLLTQALQQISKIWPLKSISKSCLCNLSESEFK